MGTDSGAITVRRLDEVIVVGLRRFDVVDPAYLVRVQMECQAVLSEVDCPLVVLDWSGVHFVTSASIGLVLALLRCVEDAGGQMSLWVPDDDVRKVFVVGRVDTVICIEAELESALRSVRRQD